MTCNYKGCKANAMKNDPDGYCFQHSQQDNVRIARDKARHEGGSRTKAQKPEIDIQSAADIRLILVEAINELRNSGTSDVIAKVRTLAHLCQVLVEVIDKTKSDERSAEIRELFDGMLS